MFGSIAMSERFFRLGKDAISGLVVFLVALPLCLGIALASNAPIVAGLLAGIVGGLVVGSISKSSTSVSGPAAGLTAIIAAQIVSLGSFEVFLAAVIIAGVVQISLGLLRTGFVAAFFPTSVIKGLLCAIGFILILKQLPHLVGFDQDFIGDMAFNQPDHENTFSELGAMLFKIHWGACAIGIASLLLLILWNRVRALKDSPIPAPLMVVVVATSIAMMMAGVDLSLHIGEEHRVQVPVISNFFDLPKLFSWPDFSSFWSIKVWFAGFSLAVVASLETLLNIEAIDKIDPLQRRSPPNRELVAQGIGNIILGLIGGLPTTSVIVRSSVNINAGGQTKKATIFHGLLLLLSVLSLPWLLNQIPLSCLAAILIVTGHKLANPKIFKEMWSQGMIQFLPFVLTFLAIVFTDLLTGVLIGLGVGLIFILQRNINGPIRVIKEHHIHGETSRIILGHQVSFLNRASLKKALNGIPKNGRLVVDASDTDYIDADVLDVIRDFTVIGAGAHNISVSAVGFKEHYAQETSLQFADYTTHDLQKNATPKQVLMTLKQGNARVRMGQRLRRDLTQQIAATSEGQFPLAVILSCIDSRVPVELVFDLGIGDALSIRMAGNVISDKVLGSIEFACSVLGAKLVVVMGHTRCGAVSAAFSSYRTGQSAYGVKGLKHLGGIVSEIQTVIGSSQVEDMLRNKGATIEACENFIVRENVKHCMAKIAHRSDCVARLLNEGAIGMVGCVYDVSNGTAEFLDPAASAKKPEVFKESNTKHPVEIDS